MSETSLSASIRKALTMIGVWVIRVQSGIIPAYYGGKVRFIHCAEPGTPDLLLPELGSWLEVKSPKGRLSSEQRAWHKRALAAGVRVAVVRSVPEAVRTVLGWRGS